VTPTPATVPASKWFFASGGQGDAEEGQVTALLDSFRALRVEKYIEPGEFNGPTYTIVIHAIPRKATEAPTDYTLTVIDLGTRVVGRYKDLTFELDRSILDKLAGDFKTKKPAPPPTPSFNGAGGPGGGMPFGQ